MEKNIKKTHTVITLFIVATLIVSMICICEFTVSSKDEVTIKYTIDFEEEGAGTVLQVNEVPVGEIVEYPVDSGNHCLRYEINENTRHSAYGLHPYMWPEGIEQFLITHGDLQSGEEIRLMADIATNGPAGEAYLYPNLLVNNVRIDWKSQCGIFRPGENEFKTGEWNFTNYGKGGPPKDGLNIDADPPVEYRSGGICFCDEQRLEEDTYIYMDNIVLSFRGDWEMNPNSPWTYLDNDNPLPVELNNQAETTQTIQTTQTEQKTFIDGDANEDGVLDLKDVLVIRKYVAGVAVTTNTQILDFNHDLSVDMKDVLAVRKKIAGIE